MISFDVILLIVEKFSNFHCCTINYFQQYNSGPICNLNSEIVIEKIALDSFKIFGIPFLVLVTSQVKFNQMTDELEVMNQLTERSFRVITFGYLNKRYLH